MIKSVDSNSQTKFKKPKIAKPDSGLISEFLSLSLKNMKNLDKETLSVKKEHLMKLSYLRKAKKLRTEESSVFSSNKRNCKSFAESENFKSPRTVQIALPKSSQTLIKQNPFVFNHVRTKSKKIAVPFERSELQTPSFFDEREENKKYECKKKLLFN